MSGDALSIFDLGGRTAVLTGAGGHLVGTLSRALGRAGVRVMVADVDRDAAEKVAGDIAQQGGEALPVVVDVRRKEDLERALEAAVSRFGAVDFLVNGAGANAPTPFFDITTEEWDRIIAVQLTGTMLACQVFGRHMVDGGKGSIVNFSSMSSGPPLSKAFTYSVAKAGVSNLTKNLAREWATAGVRVNALRPGFFPTEWSKQNFITPEREAAILGHTPMRRYGRPEELVGAVIWLLSDAASFVTGAEIEIDGGFSAMTI